MRKIFVPILFTAGVLCGSGSALCLAAEEANRQAVAPPDAVPSQATQKKVQQRSQRKVQQPSQREMHRMQKSGSKPLKNDSAAAPSPSQRSMRQKLKGAKPRPAPGNTEAR